MRNTTKTYLYKKKERPEKGKLEIKEKKQKAKD